MWEKEKLAELFDAIAELKRDARNRGFRRGSGGQASVACPVCKAGTVRYSVATINGHMHAKCTTDHCIAFME